mmetsp:Transcript_116731/g.326537  ORF Transcript_116731/g.326537 Transcript_116731/m.326537 type:complete len:451 (+) Transcript_116731:111-1463(+)
MMGALTAAPGVAPMALLCALVAPVTVAAAAPKSFLGEMVRRAQPQPREPSLVRWPSAALESGSGEAKKLGAMKAATPWFHTSDELAAEARKTAERCGGRATVESHKNGEVTIDSITIKADKPDPANRVFIVFGEHSRELITAESGLGMLKALCGEGQGSPKFSTQSLLQDNEFTLVLNANPRSRRQVEQGDFCLRANPNGVDLNRNYDMGWNAETPHDLANTNPGPHPFSELETQIMKKLMEDANPTTFLTVHSGTRGMYMPWAWSRDKLETRNRKPMMEVLEALDKDHCRCPYGAAGKEVGYAAPGTSLDYARKIKGNEFSFAFEIAASHDLDPDLKARYDEERELEKAGQVPQSFLQVARSGSMSISRPLSHPESMAFLHRYPSDFVQVAAKTNGTAAEPLTEKDCFGQYNPVTQKEYKEVVDNWVATFLEMAQMTNEKIHQLKHTAN